MRQKNVLLIVAIGFVILFIGAGVARILESPIYISVLKKMGQYLIDFLIGLFYNPIIFSRPVLEKDAIWFANHDPRLKVDNLGVSLAEMRAYGVSEKCQFMWRCIQCEQCRWATIPGHFYTWDCNKYCTNGFCYGQKIKPDDPIC